MLLRIMNKISSIKKIPFNNFDCTNNSSCIYAIHLWSRLPIGDGKNFNNLKNM